MKCRGKKTQMSPNSKDGFILIMAALIFVLDKDQPPAENAFAAARDFVAKAEKEIPEAFIDD